MKRILLIALLLAAVMLVCGCTQQSAVPETTLATPTPAPAGSLPAELSASSPNATLSLDTGVILLSFHAEGKQTMTVNFASASNEYAASNEIPITGPYDGTLVFEVPQKDEYLLNITGTGAWTATASKYVPGEGQKAPLNLTGNGTEVAPPLYLEKGQYIFERQQTGISSPMYFLSYANASPLMDANNTYVQPGFGEISTETFRIVTVPESDTYILSVIARESPTAWAASILPVPTPELGPGPEIPANETPSA
ncbi:hypothetical protein [Methanofollis fontis]|uniref:Uncharacterized protein n=1 Tax=Methanofollis fontis TaxID=2052832 RepID=A0A483CVX4_9EURY|nr:hypothetical protein [Methanofollis fontis]TAJ45687.1 hypothetical protein CUJ86_02940 [Methanofollis fontis]